MRGSVKTLSPLRTRRLAEHLRAVDRLEADAYKSSSPSGFYAAAAALTSPADGWANAFALDAGLIRPRWMQGPVGAVGQAGFTLNGTGRDFLAKQREPVANPWLPKREPLMGERTLVAMKAAA